MPSGEKAGLAESLRLRTAQGGYRYVVCYWGILESAETNREGRVVSWVPIAGPFVPDQRQEMRVRMKGLAVDAATGAWSMVTPEPYREATYTSRWSREASDQRLVENLKAKGYAGLVAALVQE